MQTVVEGFPQLVDALGGRRSEVDIKVFSYRDKLPTRSFLLNGAAAVAIEEDRGRGSVFDEPATEYYGCSDAAEDLGAKRTIVWRVGPGEVDYLVNAFHLDPVVPPADVSPAWIAQWPVRFADAVDTGDVVAHHALACDRPLPTAGKALRQDFSGPLLDLAGHDDAADVIPAVDALARAALMLEPVDYDLVDCSAARVTDDAVHLAIDAVGAVASLPAPVVVDALFASCPGQICHADGRVFVCRPRSAVSPDTNKQLDPTALHVATDAARFAARVIGDDAARFPPAELAGRIDQYLRHPILVQALALAVRARRRRVPLPAAILRRMAELEAPPGDTEHQLRVRRLLRLVAIALVPASGRSQGRVGLARLGRAAGAQPWVDTELAAFLGSDADGFLARELLVDALRDIGPAGRRGTPLPITSAVLQLWVPAVAPRLRSRTVVGLEPYRELGTALRALDYGRDLGRGDLRPQVVAIARDLGMWDRMAQDGGATARPCSVSGCRCAMAPRRR